VSEADPDDAEARLAAREFFAAALYMALVLLAVLVAVLTDRLPPDEEVAGLLVGSAIGLTLAHWLAFRLAAHLTVEGGFAGVRRSGGRRAGRRRCRRRRDCCPAVPPPRRRAALNGSLSCWRRSPP
jgi:hypothetical protein